MFSRTEAVPVTFHSGTREEEFRHAFEEASFDQDSDSCRDCS
jgi:hypothetical protein